MGIRLLRMRSFVLQVQGEVKETLVLLRVSTWRGEAKSLTLTHSKTPETRSLLTPWFLSLTKPSLRKASTSLRQSSFCSRSFPWRNLPKSRRETVRVLSVHSGLRTVAIARIVPQGSRPIQPMEDDDAATAFRGGMKGATAVATSGLHRVIAKCKTVYVAREYLLMGMVSDMERSFHYRFPLSRSTQAHD